MTLRKAEMVLNRLADQNAVMIEVPMVEDRAALVDDLADAGIRAVLQVA